MRTTKITLEDKFVSNDVNKKKKAIRKFFIRLIQQKEAHASMVKDQ